MNKKEFRAIIREVIKEVIVEKMMNEDEELFNQDKWNAGEAGPSNEPPYACTKCGRKKPNDGISQCNTCSSSAKKKA